MFIFSLPPVFAFTDLLIAEYFIALLVLIFILMNYSVPAIDSAWVEHKKKNSYELLKSCWEGQASLWKAFWPFFIFANLAFVYIDYRIDNVSYTISSWRTVHVMMFFPCVWWITAVWKCSVNTSHRYFSGCARSLTLFFMIDFCLRLLLSYQYPQILFDCRLLLLELGDCY